MKMAKALSKNLLGGNSPLKRCSKILDHPASYCTVFSRSALLFLVLLVFPLLQACDDPENKKDDPPPLPGFSWGIVGPATPSADWEKDTALNFDAASQTWKLKSIQLSAAAFKFRKNGKWLADGGEEMGPKIEIAVSAEQGSYALVSTDVPNFTVADAGEYSITLDIKNKIAKFTLINPAFRWSIVGDATPHKDWTTDTNLSFDADSQSWKLDSIQLIATEGKGFKFRKDGDFNKGERGRSGGNGNAVWGSAGNALLTSEGGNFQVSEAGEYSVKLDMANNKLVLILKVPSATWSIVGDATPHKDWEKDTNLSFDVASQTWKITLALTANSFKFRRDAAWTVERGRDGGAGDALLDGSANSLSSANNNGNFKVATAGTYNIVLDINNNTVSLTVAGTP